jgi:hypothetical protein
MIMQIKILMLMIMLGTQVAKAQLLPGGVKPDEDERPETKNRNHSGMAELGIKAANMMDSWGLELGLDINSRMNENLSVGGSLYYLVSQNLQITTNNPLYKPVIKIFYAGANVDYAYWLGRFVGVSAGALFAVGQLNFADSPSVEVGYNSNYQWFFLIEPSVNLFWKFSDGFGVSAGAGYRQSLGVSDFGLSNSDLSGLFFRLSLCSFI